MNPIILFLLDGICLADAKILHARWIELQRCLQYFTKIIGRKQERGRGRDSMSGSITDLLSV